MNSLTSLVALLLVGAAFGPKTRAQENPPKNSVTVLPKVFTLKHRWEISPDLGADWTMSSQVPQWEINLDRLRSQNQLECLTEIELVLKLASTRGISNEADVLDCLRDRLASEDSGGPFQKALLSAAISLCEPTELQTLWPLVKDNSPLRRVLELPLSEVGSPLALDTWRSRLTSASASLGDKWLAIRGVGQSGATSDREILEAIIKAPTENLAQRIAVSQALAKICPQGLENLASELRQQNMHLEAVLLLENHTSRQSGEVLTELLSTDDVAVQRHAFDALATNHPSLASELAEQFLEHSDPHVRLTALELIADSDNENSIRALSQALADPSLQNRERSRHWLVAKALSESALPEKAQAETARSLVLAQTRTSLEMALPVPGEQACILAGEADFAELCPILLTLLENPAPQISLAAAWALQELATESAILESIERFSQRATEQHFDAQVYMPETQAIQLGYLLEALGRNKIETAVPMLERYIPKQSAPAIVRASAIWALGIIKANSQDPELARKLARRLHDDNPDFPEFPIIKYVCAIGLGRIQHPQSAAQLERHYERPPFPIGLAREWGMRQFQSAPSPKP